jgi:xylulokinase
MSRERLIGIDVGTQSTRVALIDLDGHVVAAHSRSYEMETPRPGWAQQDPDLWWDAAVEGVRAVLAQAGPRPGDLLGLACDSQMHATVPLGGDGCLLAPWATLWCDKRASSLVEEFARRPFAAQAARLAANPPIAAWIGFKARWLRDEHPDLYARTWRFVTGHGYLNYRLTGEAGMDYTEASGAYLMDAERLAWSPELAEAVGVDLDKMPPLLSSTDITGRVSAAAAQQTGLPEGLPVAAGAGDMLAMLVSAGLSEQGRALDISGTASDLCVYVERPVIDRPFMNLHHALPGWVPFGIAEAGGGSLKWFKDQLCAAEAEAARSVGVDVYTLLNEKAAATEPGNDGLIYLPHLMGERLLGSPHSRGVFFGLTPRTGIGALARAIMEGVCLDLRRSLEIVEQAGNHVSEIYTSGGGARSALWSQIKADVYQKPVRTLVAEEGGVLGSALIAGTAVGVYPDLRAAAARCVHVDRTFLPNTALKPRYDALFALYKELHGRLQEPFDALASLP